MCDLLFFVLAILSIYSYIWGTNTPVMKNISLLMVCLVGTLPLLSQTDTLRTPPPEVDDPAIFEEILEDIPSEQAADWEAMLHSLQDIRRKPLNINKADEQDLLELRLLNDAQVMALLQHRQMAGHFISILELQTVRGFDLDLIRRLLPYITVGGALDDYQVRIRDMLRWAGHELYLRWNTILEQEKGYQPSANPSASGYLGNGHQYYLRYRYAYGNKLSIGLTAEKDRGEEFFTGTNPQGFDFYSAHLALRNYTSRIKAIILGDFTVAMGQGLILMSGLRFGKSISSIGSKRSGLNLRPYTSASEAGFMRGAAAAIALSRQLNLTTFISLLRQDGTITNTDTLDQQGLGGGFESIGSIQISGLHRTPQEVANRGTIWRQSAGASVKWSLRQHHLAVNTLYSRTDKPLPLPERPESQFNFTGHTQVNASFDYGLRFRNTNFFGETALSGNMALAHVHGLILNLDKNSELTLLYRHYDRDFHSFAGAAIHEGSGIHNEAGLYLGLEFRPTSRWKINAYADTWRHPWLKFGADAPSHGTEYRARFTYSIRRSLTVYMEIRQKNREANFRNNTSPIDYLSDTQQRHLRLHLAKTVSKALEFRTRLDLGDYDDGSDMPRLQGVSLYQDIIYKPLGKPLSFTARFALYDTDGFAVRFYQYENNMLFVASNQAYYHRGTRFYINLRYRPYKPLTLELRIAQTYWANQRSMGSGLEKLEGPVRTQAAMQLRYQF
jgi:hypothetical protein